MQGGVKRKWRPTLALVVAIVLGLVLALPLAGLFLFQFYANQLVQQTEESLLAQSAILAAGYATTYRELDDGAPRGRPVATPFRPSPGQVYRPDEPGLSLATDTIHQPRADALPPAAPPEPLYARIGRRLSPVTETAQLRTLAGYRLLDPEGVVIGGTGEVGLSLGHVPEVRRALRGETVSHLRQRISDEPVPPIYSVSRGTKVRIFVAMPVVVDGRVIGVVYSSRTPSNIVRYLYAQRQNLALAGLTVLAATALIGTVFWRFITQPIRNLITQTGAIAEAREGALQPLPHYGTSEVASLGDSFLAMATALTDRQEALRNFTAHVTHELKSPLTSIQGAAELLLDQDEDMAPGDRRRFVANIAKDAERMDRLLHRLRDLARARLPATSGTARLSATVAALPGRFPFEIAADAEYPVTGETLSILLTHLAENSLAHGATRILLRPLSVGGPVLEVIDNGAGISKANRDKVFEPFFTTRREDGGTGMGLAIVASLMAANGGTVTVLEIDGGAGFRLEFG